MTILPSIVGLVKRTSPYGGGNMYVSWPVDRLVAVAVVVVVVVWWNSGRGYMGQNPLTNR